MLYTLAVILLIAWLLGVVGTYTIGAFVHVLLALAIVLFIILGAATIFGFFGRPGTGFHNLTGLPGGFTP